VQGLARAQRACASALLAYRLGERKRGRRGWRSGADLPDLRRPPVLNANLATRADNKDMARCQFEMLKRAGRLENTVLKEINKAKKQALKDEAVDSDAALEAKLRAVLASNDRITRSQDGLVKGVDRKCAVLQPPTDTIFPGECGEGAPT
jgi:hypothetical protein